MRSGRGWLANDWPSTGGVLSITAVAWTAGSQWRSGNITRMQNVSEYMLVLALCLVSFANSSSLASLGDCLSGNKAAYEGLSVSVRIQWHR